MAYTPSIQDMADIVRRWRANLAEAYPPQPASQVQLPQVEVPGWAPDYVPPMPGSGQPFVPGGTVNPGATARMAPGGGQYPSVLPTPGASVEMGFPTQPGSALSVRHFVPAPAGYGSGVRVAGSPPPLSSTVTPLDPAMGSTVTPLDPAMGRTTDLSLPPGFLQDYQRTKQTNQALAANAILNGQVGGPFAGASMSDIFGGLQQPAPTLPITSAQSTTLAGGPLALSRRLS